MKRFNDYLIENGSWEYDGDFNFKVNVVNVGDETFFEIWHEGEMSRMKEDDDIEYAVDGLFYGLHDTEIRFCEICGKPMQAGYTTDDGSYYCCEECFDGDMNKLYGKGNWRACEEENSLNGWYEYLEDGEWTPDPSYYTEWY